METASRRRLCIWLFVSLAVCGLLVGWLLSRKSRIDILFDSYASLVSPDGTWNSQEYEPLLKLYEEMVRQDSGKRYAKVSRMLKYGTSHERLAAVSFLYAWSIQWGVQWRGTDRERGQDVQPGLKARFSILFREDDVLVKNMLQQNPNVRTLFCIVLLLIDGDYHMATVSRLALTDPDENVRTRLLSSLSLFIRDDKVNEILSVALKDSSPIVRLVALQEMYSRTHEKSLVPQLVDMLRTCPQRTLSVLVALRNHDDTSRSLFETTVKRLGSTKDYNNWSNGLPEDLLSRWEDWAKRLSE